MRFFHCFGAGVVFCCNLHSLTSSYKKHSTAIYFAQVFYCKTNASALEDLVIQKISTNFVWKELTKLEQTKATGLDGLTARLLKDTAPVIAKPITYLVNVTISTGVIPSEWKEARVTPIFKLGVRNDENNYWLISILLLISNVMERAIQVQLLAFLAGHNSLSVYQSGF